jgi:flagellar biosynthesis protein FlhG
MSDQAQTLRDLVKSPNIVKPPNQRTGSKTTRIITVSSGKGGVGKSNFTLNFALALQALGYKVLVFDADIGLANIDVLMGVSPKYSLYHLLKKEKTIEEIICEGNHDLQFIAGGSGFNDLLNLSDAELNTFVEEVSKLNGKVDFILFDTGAGLSKETLKFIVSAQETILVTTPEPTAITDAYAVIKMVRALDLNIKFQLVINRVSHRKEGKQTADKISLVAKQFLGLDIPTLGYVLDDMNVTKAVKKQIPFTVAYPNSSASKAINELAINFLSNQHTSKNETDGVKGFLNRIMNLVK